MTEDVRRRRALVTGASTGIGEAFARALAARGYDLVLVARRGAVLEVLAKELAGEFGTEVSVAAADLTIDEELRGVEEIVRNQSELDLLVNNAGFGSEGRFQDLDVEWETRMVRLNCEALVRLSHAAVSSMVSRGRGGIINVSSGAAFVPGPFLATYAATKAFVNQFTEGLAVELEGSGVTLQALCPGFTRTEFQERAGVDTGSIPEFAWMEPEAVVAESLRALERGSLVCVPGALNRALPVLSGPLARPLLRRLVGAIGRRRAGA